MIYPPGALHPRLCHFRGSYNENPVFFVKLKQQGKGWGVKCIQACGAGQDVGQYGGKPVTAAQKAALVLLDPKNNKWLKISDGATPLYVNGVDVKRGSLAALINHGCGVDERCEANCKVIFDDVRRKEPWVVTTRAIRKGEWLALDYGYRYEEEVDGDDLTMGWMKGLRCTVCFPLHPPRGRYTQALGSPVMAEIMYEDGEPIPLVDALCAHVASRGVGAAIMHGTGRDVAEVEVLQRDPEGLRDLGLELVVAHCLCLYLTIRDGVSLVRGHGWDSFPSGSSVGTPSFQ